MERIKDWYHPQAFVELLSFLGKIFTKPDSITNIEILERLWGTHNPREVVSKNKKKSSWGDESIGCENYDTSYPHSTAIEY